MHRVKKRASQRAPGPVLVVHPCGETDILAAFLDWHLEVVGIPLVLALDVTPPEDEAVVAEVAAILNDAAQRHPGRVIWRRAAETRDSRSPLWQVGDAWCAIAASEYNASWVIHVDVDELIVVPESSGASLNALLSRAALSGTSVLQLPRYTMTGRAPPEAPDASPSPPWNALTDLDVRVNRPTVLSRAQMVDAATSPLEHPLPVPFPFVDVGPHLAVLSSALTPFSAGGGHRISPAHGDVAEPHSWTTNPTSPYILTYPTRSRAHFDRRIAAIRPFLSVNDHLELPMLWHWRRLIALADAGSGALDREFRAQFLPFSPDTPSDATTLDRTVANWFMSRSRA